MRLCFSPAFRKLKQFWPSPPAVHQSRGGRKDETPTAPLWWVLYLPLRTRLSPRHRPFSAPACPATRKDLPASSGERWALGALPSPSLLQHCVRPHADHRVDATTQVACKSKISSCVIIASTPGQPNLKGMGFASPQFKRRLLSEPAINCRAQSCLLGLFLEGKDLFGQSPGTVGG